ncbi:short-chain dehydrogenase/reductase [Lentzea pudingi]|uniref:Short-chain dehydrogenase/reductase n=1 Tax=Lentzea pudingi TaxID=1789439 RepID=A0ABQ2HXA2_9PSEU|nr:SDR family oxidoreductase [Lentzea pudingi]GGM94344.1 short-chain dehydrogenase/reductase [Lentzea pudingi]
MNSGTVLITGTSSGIGLATTVAAARAGWRAVATMRDTSRAKALLAELDSAGLTDLVDVRHLDVTDRDSVDACIRGVVADYGRLDALINNAGSGHVGTLEQDTIETIREVMEVNFFGVLAVTRAALPHLRAASGRIVTITSVGGVVGQPFNEAYCAAKFAVEGFMESLAPVAAGTGVKVIVVEPGAVASEFVGNTGVQAVDIDANGPYAPALRAYLERTSGAFADAQTPADAAASIVTALTSDTPPFRVQTSDRARAFAGVKLADMDGSAVQNTLKAWLG